MRSLADTSRKKEDAHAIMRSKPGQVALYLARDLDGKAGSWRRARIVWSRRLLSKAQTPAPQQLGSPLKHRRFCGAGTADDWNIGLEVIALRDRARFRNNAGRGPVPSQTESLQAVV